MGADNAGAFLTQRARLRGLWTGACGFARQVPVGVEAVKSSFFQISGIGCPGAKIVFNVA